MNALILSIVVPGERRMSATRPGTHEHNRRRISYPLCSWVPARVIVRRSPADHLTGTTGF